MEVTTCYAVIAPRRTPANIVKQLNTGDQPRLRDAGDADRLGKARHEL